jgi:hypothetical protein
MAAKESDAEEEPEADGDEDQVHEEVRRRRLEDA